MLKCTVENITVFPQVERRRVSAGDKDNAKRIKLALVIAICPDVRSGFS